MYVYIYIYMFYIYDGVYFGYLFQTQSVRHHGKVSENWWKPAPPLRIEATWYVVVAQCGAPRNEAPPKIFHVLKKLTPRNERKVRQNHRFWRVLGWVAKSGLRKNGGWEMGGWECGKWKCFRGDAPTVFCWEGYKIDAAIWSSWLNVSVVPPPWYFVEKGKK